MRKAVTLHSVVGLILSVEDLSRKTLDSHNQKEFCLQTAFELEMQLFLGFPTSWLCFWKMLTHTVWETRVSKHCLSPNFFYLVEGRTRQQGTEVCGNFTKAWVTPNCRAANPNVECVPEGRDERPLHNGRPSCYLSNSYLLPDEIPQ